MGKTYCPERCGQNTATVRVSAPCFNCPAPAAT